MTVAVNENTTLVEDTIEQHRRTRINSPQIRQVDPAVDDLGDSIGNVVVSWGSARRERDQQVEVRIVILIAARHGAVDHRKTDIPLSPQRPPQLGNQMPVSLQVLTLARRQQQPPRSGPAGAEGALRGRASKRALLDAKVIR